MKAVGAFEAKTHFSALLERAAGGEATAITRHGATVAMLIPAGQSKEMTPAAAVAALRDFRAGRKATRRTMRRWVEEGRT